MARPRSAYVLSISSFFIAYLINQLINRIVSWVQIHLFFMLICLEDVYYLLQLFYRSPLAAVSKILP